MMELLTLVGGVDPQLLWKGFIVSAGVAVLGCSLATSAVALGRKDSRGALAHLRRVAHLAAFAARCSARSSWMFGWPWIMPPRAADPFWLVLAPYWNPRSVDWSDYLWFLAVTCGMSIVLIFMAIAQDSRRLHARERAEAGTNALARLDIRASGNGSRAAIPWLSPSLEGNPVLWREWNRVRPSRWASRVIALYVRPLVVLQHLRGDCRWGAELPVFVNGLQVAIGLLLLSVTAATSLAEERVRGSLDLLMSTSLSTREIVQGKWLGVFRVGAAAGDLAHLSHWNARVRRDAGLWSAPVMFIYVLCAGAAVTSLGLALATRLSRVGQAVGATVLFYVGFTVGWFFLMLSMSRARGNRQRC